MAPLDNEYKYMD